METKPLNQFPEEIQAKALDLFYKLANSQRGLPETLATVPNANPGLWNATGAFTWMCEHIGDLTHRMAQKHCERMRFGQENVAEKVRKALRYFNNGYGFSREVEGNLESNYRYRTKENEINIPFEQFEEQWIVGAKKYANAHAQLTVWNECQWHAREAARCLGYRHYNLLESHLNVLSKHLKDDTWEDWASIITVNGNNIVPYHGLSKTNIKESIEDNYLQNQYDYYNALLFDGQLPKIPITQRQLKNAGGKALCKFILSNRPKPNPIMVRLGREDKLSNYDATDIRIVISNTYKRENHQIDKILIHEMIHVYFYVFGPKNESHGYKFREQIRRCSKIVGFELPLKDEVEGLEFTKETKLKPIGVILLEKKKGGVAVAILGKDHILSTSDHVKGFLGYRAKIYKDTVSLYIVNDEVWSELARKYPIQRPNKSIKLFVFDDNQSAINDLKKNGRLVGTITGDY